MRTRGRGRGRAPDIGNLFATLRGQAIETPTTDYNRNDFVAGMESLDRGRSRGSVRLQILMRNVQRILDQMENQPNQTNAPPQQLDPVRAAKSGRGGRGARGVAIRTPSSRKTKGRGEPQADPPAKRSHKSVSPKKNPPAPRNNERGWSSC